MKMSNEIKNCLMTILPIAIDPIFGILFIFIKNKYIACFIYSYLLLSFPLVGIIIIIKKKVFLKIWLLKKEKLFLGSLYIGVWLLGVLYFWGDIINFYMNLFNLK
ncbi:hypothetical protein HMPREF1221_01313 [Treponema socranskii subsp. paredis ATCC 35535]|nr:hypothetical protein HMPREF1221_01313 [Treponema socranskii subsp. paredis ATCC 35535]